MVTEKEIGVYGKLFDIAAGNMESAGKEMEIDRDAFLAVVHMDPHRADMLRPCLCKQLSDHCLSASFTYSCSLAIALYAGRMIRLLVSISSMR